MSRLLNIVAQVNDDGTVHVWHQIGGPAERDLNAGVLYNDEHDAIVAICKLTDKLRAK